MGLAPLGPAVQRGSDSPGPACVALSILPCPPVGWQRGPLWGGGRAQGSHDTQAGPASCSAASEAHGSPQSCCVDLRRWSRPCLSLARQPF